MNAISIHSIPNDFHWHGAKPLILHFDAFTYALSHSDDIFQWESEKKTHYEISSTCLEIKMNIEKQEQLQQGDFCLFWVFEDKA